MNSPSSCAARSRSTARSRARRTSSRSERAANESIVAAFSLVLGTATPGGGFPVFGAAFTEVINAAEPRLRIQAQNTKGSSENVPLLEAGKIDLGLIAGEYASALMARPDTKLRVIAAMYSSPGLFIVKRSEEHTSELQSRVDISYAVF